MLAGVRDSRIGSVINWAGPAGWFYYMGTYGFTFREQVQWSLWTRGKGWGSSRQFIEWFFEESIGAENSRLGEIRHKILASAPLYFLETLPPAQLHYGIEDRSVPIANAIAIRKALTSRDESAPAYEIYEHENTGHDQPYPETYQLSKQFLLRQFSKP